MILFHFLFFYCQLKPFIHQCSINLIFIPKFYTAVIECYTGYKIQRIQFTFS